MLNKITPKVIIGFVIGLIVILFIVLYLVEQKQRSVADQVAGIVLKGNIADCAKFNGTRVAGVDYEAVCKNNILQNQATNAKSIEACDTLEGTSLSPDSCKEKVAIEIARSAISEKNCSLLSNEKYVAICVNAFWEIFAQKNNDVSACSHLQAEARKNCELPFLLNQLNFDYKKVNCTKYENNLAKNCSLLIAALNKPKDGFLAQTTQCTKIPEEDLASFCELNIKH